MKEYSLMFKNALNFKGKSSRREYWMAVAVNALVSLILSFTALPFIYDTQIYGVASTSVISLYEIIIFVPMLALTVRRIRDVGKSPWNILWAITWVGVIYLLILLSKPSNFRVNAWYANYKDNPDQIILEDEKKSEQTQQTNSFANQQDDSIEKIIDDLNKLKMEGKISQYDYDELIKKLTKKQ